MAISNTNYFIARNGVATSIVNGTTCVVSPITCGSTCVVGAVTCGTTCSISPIFCGTSYVQSPCFCGPATSAACATQAGCTCGGATYASCTCGNAATATCATQAGCTCGGATYASCTCGNAATATCAGCAGAFCGCACCAYCACCAGCANCAACALAATCVLPNTNFIAGCCILVCGQFFNGSNCTTGDGWWRTSACATGLYNSTTGTGISFICSGACLYCNGFTSFCLTNGSFCTNCCVCAGGCLVSPQAYIGCICTQSGGIISCTYICSLTGNICTACCFLAASMICSSTCIYGPCMYSTGSICGLYICSGCCLYAGAYSCAGVCLISPIVCGITSICAPCICATSCYYGQYYCGTGYMYIPLVYATSTGLSICACGCICAMCCMQAPLFAGTATNVCCNGGHTDNSNYPIAWMSGNAIYTTGAGFCVYPAQCGFYVGGCAWSGTGFYGPCICGGAITSGGNITAYSDCRLKSNIETVKDALEKTAKLRGVTYVKDGKATIGLIAQEVQHVLPELVFDNPDGYLTLAYQNIIGVLVEAIKEIKTEMEQQKEALNNLK